MIYQHEWEVRTQGKGPYALTREIRQQVQQAGVSQGLVHVFCRHTSCSLVLMEDADPTAWEDLEAFMDRLVPERLDYFEHTLEGPDDMPSHIRMALTRSSETLPLRDSQLQLGTWQGLFLWEHRRQAHHRRLFLTIMGE